VVLLHCRGSSAHVEIDFARCCAARRAGGSFTYVEIDLAPPVHGHDAMARQQAEPHFDFGRGHFLVVIHPVPKCGGS
jgi:hypothetical protein